MWIIIFLSTECVKNFPVDKIRDILWITGNPMLIKMWTDCVKNQNVQNLENFYTHNTWRKYWKNWKCPHLVHSKIESYPQGYPQIVDNVDYGYNISCGKHKNRTGICTRVADSVDKLWKNQKSMHSRSGHAHPGKPRQSGIFPEKNCENY